MSKPSSLAAMVARGLRSGQVHDDRTRNFAHPAPAASSALAARQGQPHPVCRPLAVRRVRQHVLPVWGIRRDRQLSREANCRWRTRWAWEVDAAALAAYSGDVGPSDRRLPAERSPRSGIRGSSGRSWERSSCTPPLGTPGYSSPSRASCHRAGPSGPQSGGPAGCPPGSHPVATGHGVLPGEVDYGVVRDPRVGRARAMWMAPVGAVSLRADATSRPAKPGESTATESHGMAGPLAARLIAQPLSMSGNTSASVCASGETTKRASSSLAETTAVLVPMAPVVDGQAAHGGTRRTSHALVDAGQRAASGSAGSRTRQLFPARSLTPP